MQYNTTQALLLRYISGYPFRKLHSRPERPESTRLARTTPSSNGLLIAHMVELRVTKYSPALRDAQGRYTRNDWTSVSDVGSEWADGVLTLERYLAIEDQYVSVVEQLMQSAGVSELCISHLEVHEGSWRHVPSALQEETRSDLELVRIGRPMGFDLIQKVVRLTLREVMWCRLIGTRDFYVHFGYDYYMFVGFSGQMDEIANVSTPLFVESFASPCHPDEAEDVIGFMANTEADTAWIRLGRIPPTGVAATYRCGLEGSTSSISLNFDADGRLLGIELSPASKLLSLDFLEDWNRLLE